MYFMSDRATVGDGTGGAVLACHREAVSDAGFRDYSMYGFSHFQVNIPAVLSAE